MKIGSVVETINGNIGQVIDFHSGDPVVFFEGMGKFARISWANCSERFFTDRYGMHPSEAVKADFKMPLSYGILIGFNPLVADYYSFEPKIAGRKYPWDKGSIWKVVESSGQKFLVREAETGTDIDNSHTLENDGTNAESPTGEAPLFDSNEGRHDKAYV